MPDTPLSKPRGTWVAAFAGKVRLLIATASLLACLAPAAHAGDAVAPRPQRIVSLNLCADQLLADLVPRERIRAVSFLGADPAMSAAAGKLAGIRTVQGAAEEVLALDPDLVVAGQYSTPATVRMLEQLGRRVVVIELASDFDGIRRAVAMLAAAVGEVGKGRELLAKLDTALAGVRQPAGPRPTAIAYQVNSLVSSKGSLVDAILTAAGFDNLATRERLGPGGRLSLETLALAPPDLLILAHGPDEFRTAVADNLRHPVLLAVMRMRPVMRLGMPMWLCGTPAVVDAITELAAIRDQMGAPR